MSFMKSSIYGIFFVALLTVVGSGCYMNLQATDSELITRLDGLEQRVTALEQGRPPLLPGAATSQLGRVSTAEYTEDAEEAKANPRPARRPAGRRRLKETPPRPAKELPEATETESSRPIDMESGEAPNPDDE
jgi:hypothetical protein